MSADELLDCFFFFFQAEDGIRDLIVTGVQTCALPISARSSRTRLRLPESSGIRTSWRSSTLWSRKTPATSPWSTSRGAIFPGTSLRDRKSTRLNSSHDQISYAVFCLKKKKKRAYTRAQPLIGRQNLPLARHTYILSVKDILQQRRFTPDTCQTPASTPRAVFFPQSPA